MASSSTLKSLFALAFLLFICLNTINAQISITGTGFSYTQDFANYNGLSGGLPTGWNVTFTGSATYNGQGTGSSATGGAWSYGVAADSDRGAGALRSGTPGNITHTVSFTNNTGTLITSLRISYNFEQWRYVNTSGFSVSQTGLGSANVSSLGQNGSATGTNGTVTTIPRTLTLSGLTLANGATFTLSWVTSDASGADNGVAIDDFVLDNVTLPVEMVSIKAMPVSEKTSIVWQTASELNNSHFSVERSGDGSNYEEIGIVNGKGTSYDFNNYSFLDENPLPGKNYYRLKQLDFDGQFEYSKVVSVDFSSNGRAKLYPTYADNFVNIEFSEPLETEAILTIFDLTGRLVASQLITAESTASQVHVAGLQAGHYTASIQQEGKIDVLRFVKQ